jgi:hypothetical protein
MIKEGSPNMKNSIKEASRSELDLIDRGYVVLEMHHNIENQTLSLANRMVANDGLFSRYLT